MKCYVHGRDDFSKLSVHDRRIICNSQRYLRALNKHGRQALLKRPFWRKFVGINTELK